MSTTQAPELRRRRWWIAASALCLVAGLQLATIPPEVFADPGVCFMSCSVEGRSCCCKELASVAGAHAPDGHFAAFERTCHEPCATFANKAPGSDVWLLGETRRDLARSASAEQRLRARAPFGALDHSDPSTLPRPPPSPITRS